MARMSMARCLQIFLIFLFMLHYVDCCGTSTHIEISYRAQDSFHTTNSKLNYENLLLKHQDALEAGSPYPDAFYDSLCFSGKYHDISEDTHWTPFMNATINYIRKHYPPPWDQATEKLVVFLLGVVSHQVADVSWHGLGIAQGFLDAMAAVNFHGSFSSAHGTGDIGGDVLVNFAFNVSHMPYLSEWYVPVDDLYNIYTELYGASVMPKNVIQDCTLELFAERFGERLAIDKVYSYFAGKSPFLNEQLTDYFLGGIDDMAVWTQNVWQEAILMLEKGTEECRLDHNPLFIQCKGGKQKPFRKTGGKPERNGFYRKRMFTDVGKKDIIARKALRGVTLSPAHHVQEALQLRYRERKTAVMERRRKQPQTSATEKAPSGVFSINSTYAKLGWAMTTGDLDGDGNDDVVIGAPGYRQGSSPQDGAVFVLYGTDQGLTLSSSNIEEAADVILHAQSNETGDSHTRLMIARIDKQCICVNQAHGRLGSSVAIVDINLDGINDIAAGAPSVGTNTLNYTGLVEIFLGTGQRRFDKHFPIYCHDQNCNLGRSMAAGDINGDGFPDLLIGSPFAGHNGDQRGLVTAVISSKNVQDRFADVTMPALQWKFYGSQIYSWFGQSVDVVANSRKTGETLVLVSQPTLRSCALPNCSFSEKDVQNIGQLIIFPAYKGKLLSPIFQKNGSENFQNFGSSAAIGKPFPDGTPVLAVGVTGKDVRGTVADIDMTFPRTGAVILYNLSNPEQPPLTVFNGDRRYGQFGSQIKFSDINGDGFDDLLTGSPLRTDDFTEAIRAGEQGAAYIYYGGSSFPKGTRATFNCSEGSWIKPCPSHVASVQLTFGENKARFGSQFAVVRTKTKVDLLVTALHSSEGARLSGAVAVYSFP